MCVLASWECLSISFCAVLWAAAPGLVAVLPIIIIIMQRFTRHKDDE